MKTHKLKFIRSGTFDMYGEVEVPAGDDETPEEIMNRAHAMEFTRFLPNIIDYDDDAWEFTIEN